MTLRKLWGVSTGLATALLVSGQPVDAQPAPLVPHAFVVSEDRTSIQILDVEAERIVDIIDAPGGRVDDIESTADGGRVYVLDSGTILEYDARSGDVLRSANVGPSTRNFEVARDGSKVLFTANDRVSEVDLDIGVIGDHGFQRDIVAIGMSADGLTGYSINQSRVVYFELSDKGLDGELGGPQSANAMAVSPNGELVAIGGQKLVSVFGKKVERGHEVDLAHPTFADGLAFGADHLVYAATAGGIVVVDLIRATARTVADVSLPFGITVLGNDVVGVGPDGRFQAIDADNGGVTLDVALPEGGSALAMAMAPRRVPPTEPTAPSEPPATSTTTQQPAQPSQTQSQTAAPTGSSEVLPGDGDNDGGDTAAPVTDDLATTGASVGIWVGLGLLLTTLGGLALWMYRARTRRS